MHRFLTKSRFKVALECPSKLFYYGKKEYPSTLDNNDFMAALAEGGFQVGELAKCYYPDGVEVKTLDYRESLQKTNALLKQENVVIFEAAVQFRNFFIRIDILKKSGNNIELIEVKAKSFNPGEDSFLNKSGFVESGWLPYLQDVAFQTWVAEQAFPEYTITPYLMLADKSQKATVDGLNQRFRIFRDENGRASIKVTGDVSLAALGNQLLVTIPVREYVNMIFDGRDIPEKKKDQESKKRFIERAEEYAAYYQKDEQYPISIGPKCKHCEYNIKQDNLELYQKSGFVECWQKQLGWKADDFNRPHIFDIWNFRKTQQLMDEGIYFQQDIIPEDIFMEAKKGILRYKSAGAERQHLQVSKTLNPQEKPEEINDGLFLEMAGWKYPLHFIDFETSMVAIPFNKGRRTYEQTAFQFSSHTVFEDGSFEHQEWIASEPGKFPNYDFVTALKMILDKDDGTIFRYAAHENTVLRQIQRQLDAETDNRPDNVDELIHWIDTVTQWKEDVSVNGKKETIIHAGERNMVDMLELVKKYYYHRTMGGSNSIKAVLPAVMQASAFLKEKYSKPYNSKNYRNWIWWQLNKETGLPYDPYKLLPPLFDNIDISKNEFILESDTIKEGGAAMTAYAKMQFTEMDDIERHAIVSGLLKYCELDTLAMVMIYEHWNDLKNKGY